MEIDRSTLAEWVGNEPLLAPLVEALRRHVLSGQKLDADDTPVPVLAPGWERPKRDGCGRMYAMTGRRQVWRRRRYGSATQPIVKASIRSST